MTPDTENTEENLECCGEGCCDHEENITKMEKDENEETPTKLACDDNIKVEESVETPVPSYQPPPLTPKEIKSLKKLKYDEKKDDYDTSYVIMHKRTGQILQLKARNSSHAGSWVGWRPRHVKVLEVIEDQPENNNNTDKQETKVNESGDKQE